MLVDLLKMIKILVDFLSIFEKSVEFFAPNTDWFGDMALLCRLGNMFFDWSIVMTDHA